MEKKRRVIIYGSDLVVSAFAQSLRTQGGFQVIQIDPLHPDAFQKLESGQPDAVLFDLASAQPDFTMALLRKQPGLLLIGVDLGRDKMLVIFGEEFRLLTTHDLVQVISRRGQ